MPRRPRIKLAEVPQHVVQCGINREPCFFAWEDYHCYLLWIQKSANAMLSPLCTLFCVSTPVGPEAALSRTRTSRIGNGKDYI